MLNLRRALGGLMAGLVAAAVTAVAVPTASGLPLAPAATTAVPGVPSPCYSTHEWPADASLGTIKAQLEKDHGLVLTGSGWTDPQYRPVVKQVWITLDAITCVPYLNEIRSKTKSSTIKIVAESTRSWAWADWGLSNPNRLTFDFSKWITALPDDPGRLTRIIIHELGHAWNTDRDAAPVYWRTFGSLYATQGKFSGYGDNDMETMSEVIGYYVARCAKDNPYDDPKQASANAAYYAFVKTYVFHGVEFGPAPGVKPSC